MSRKGIAAASAMVAAAALVAGCGGLPPEVQNRQARQEVARQAQLPGSAYVGWRVYQDKCVGCHGSDATGTTVGPDLTQRLRRLGPRDFAGVVLRRYDLGQPPNVRRDDAARAAAVDDVMRRREPPLEMPAFGAEPRVQAQVADLYAYLSARAEGTLGPGRPAP